MDEEKSKGGQSVDKRANKVCYSIDSYTITNKDLTAISVRLVRLSTGWDNYSISYPDLA